jgi:hypothetical protein
MYVVLLPAAWLFQKVALAAGQPHSLACSTIPLLLLWSSVQLCKELIE